MDDSNRKSLKLTLLSTLTQCIHSIRFPAARAPIQNGSDDNDSIFAQQ